MPTSATAVGTSIGLDATLGSTTHSTAAARHIQTARRLTDTAPTLEANHWRAGKKELNSRLRDKKEISEA
jgi:hypothetical protein